MTAATFRATTDADVSKEIEAQRTMPHSEWDFTYQKDEYGRASHVIDLRTLATEATATGDLTNPGTGNPQRASIALREYGIAKSSMGFTPEEIKSGKTKHGVPFNPAEIDAEHIAVFRDKAQLVKEWNGGDFSPLFEQIKNSVHLGPKTDWEDFYNKQLALLSRR